MNENKKFLEDLRNSKSSEETLNTIINFKESEKELNTSEIIEMINIIVENRQVFDDLKLWKDYDYPENDKAREFISKYVDILNENKESLNQYTLNNLNKVFNTIYLLLLKNDIKKEEVYLYHANSVITSLGFITSKRLFSRKYGEDTGLPQTYQKSDEVDKQKDIFNDIFFDNSDIGSKVICYYGPITFVFKAHEILHSEREIKITRYNPIENLKEPLYFSTLSEIENQMIRYIEGEDGGYRFHTRFKHHTTVRDCDFIEITKENLECIRVECVDNVAEVKSAECYSSKKIKKMLECALEKANLKGIKVIIRDKNNEKKKDSRSKDGNPYSTGMEELWSSDLEVLYKKDK
jgi:hypothetical protein